MSATYNTFPDIPYETSQDARAISEYNKNPVGSLQNKIKQTNPRNTVQKLSRIPYVTHELLFSSVLQTQHYQPLEKQQ
jgi:hypothetical protein